MNGEYLEVLKAQLHPLYLGLRELSFPEVFNQHELVLTICEVSSLNREFIAQKIGQRLKELGYVQVTNPWAKNGYWKVNGVKTTVWRDPMRIGVKKALKFASDRKRLWRGRRL